MTFNSPDIMMHIRNLLLIDGYADLKGLIAVKPFLLRRTDLFSTLRECFSDDFEKIAAIYALGANLSSIRAILDHIFKELQDTRTYARFIFECTKAHPSENFTKNYINLIQSMDQATRLKVLEEHDYSLLPVGVKQGINAVAVLVDALDVIRKIAL